MKFFRFGKENGKQVTAFNSDFLLSRIVQTKKPANINCMYLEEKV